MRLNKVELLGFKSFCDRQELDFQAGVTGIVGPNGCGKSNVSDAISWVLGEQSPKSLRGKSMADVIFAGSQSRQPLGMAEVRLEVGGLNGNSPDGRPSCVVARRLYRNGESEYLMNDRVCRLRDIHELFMDTGLGSKAYSIIEQGKIGQILSTRPTDRRALIEEAAGITKYRARRRQTGLKLDAAQQNLLRVNDIVHEVEKQVDSLKRQASKARRYRVLREELQDRLRVVFGRRFVELQETARSLDERIHAEREREGAASLALQTEEAQLEARRTALYEEDAQLEQARQRQAELTRSVDRDQGRIGYCREQIGEAESRAAESRREAERLQERVGPLEAELEGRRAEGVRLRGEIDERDALRRESEQAVAACGERLHAAEADLESARDAQVGRISRIATLENSRENVSGNADRAAADLVKLAAEREELERERARLQEDRAAAHTRETQGRELHEQLATRRDAAESRAATARGRAERLAREGEARQSERDSLAGRLASLEEIVATHAAFDEGVRALLGMAAEDPANGGATFPALGVVADAVETDARHERAVEAFLGDRLQAVLVPEASDAAEGIRRLREAGAGRCAFLPLAGTPSGRNGVERLRAIVTAEPGARGLLGDVVNVTGPHAQAIRAALPHAIVTETLEAALDLAVRHEPVDCVTLAGETVRGALVEGGRGGQALLAPRREIREITTRLAELDALLLSLREQARGESEAARLAEAEARELEQRLHDVDKDLVALHRDLSALEAESGRLHRKASVLEAEREQAERERGAAAVRLAEIAEALGRSEIERQDGARLLDELTLALGSAREAHEGEKARAAEQRSALAALRERLAAAEAEVTRLERDRDELRARIEGCRSRVGEAEARQVELAEEKEACERRLSEALQQRDQTVSAVGLAEDRVRDMRHEIEGREQALKQRRHERDVLRGALSELEVQQARTHSDLDHVGRESQQSIERPAAEAAQSLAPEEREADLGEIEERIASLREKLDKMGPVNILAVEQSQELHERLEFLTAQRQDLLESIAELQQAVRKIDKTSRERFKEAFEAINQHFGEVFQKLFGGGAASLSLIDETDLLESGIDIMAQPPGKRLQNVMLLSGGEKAMTAIALLFAIFQYKPSPFCLLDEVDAPLDDANIGRFVGMLQTLKEQTQFVLITHSRKTMEIADQLYGVTMEEPGVSKLVSVKLA